MIRYCATTISELFDRRFPLASKLNVAGSSPVAGFEQFRPRIDGVIERLFDLEDAFTKYFCHPDFYGSTSIKKTLPVVAPMSYAGLQIGDGSTATAQFTHMARDECHEDEYRTRRAVLLQYCKRDTLAMVKLHESLAARCTTA